MNNSKKIEQMLARHPELWKAGELALGEQTIETGYDALDSIMPGQGWPTNTLMEFILPAWGVGELRLLMPLLRTINQKAGWIIWIAPPHIPYAPYLVAQEINLSRVLVISEKVPDKECLWTMEKLLRADSCGVALCWSEKITHNAMRRLQLAAEAGQSIGIIFRLTETKTSAAALRMRLQATAKGIHVEVIKARGGSRHRQIEVAWW